LKPTLLPNHYPSLHGLRVFAIVLVVQLHATWAMLFVGIVSFTTDMLWFGMDLFFLLSGFLIGSMLLAESPSGRRVNMRRFYLRRTFRIFPPYFVVLTLLSVLWPLNATQRANLPYEYAYLTNYIAPGFEKVVMPWGWSLAVEEHFYLVVPLLVALLRRLRSPRAQIGVLLGLWVSAPLVRLWTYLYRGPWDFDHMFGIIYEETHLRYDILIAGVLLATVQHHYKDSLARWLERGSVRFFLGALSLAAFASIAFTRKVQRELWLPYDLLCWGTITSIGYVPLVLMLLNHEGWLSKALSHRFFAYIATVGYGIYLLHTPVIHQLVLPAALLVKASLHVPWPVLWSLTIVLSLAVSAFGGYVLHVLVEKPALKLRDRFSP
jgi:peptidoglycan/LPS O-acetylase OafA/YrhL